MVRDRARFFRPRTAWSTCSGPYLIPYMFVLNGRKKGWTDILQTVLTKFTENTIKCNLSLANLWPVFLKCSLVYGIFENILFVVSSEGKGHTWEDKRSTSLFHFNVIACMKCSVVQACNNFTSVPPTASTNSFWALLYVFFSYPSLSRRNIFVKGLKRAKARVG